MMREGCRIGYASMDQLQQCDESKNIGVESSFSCLQESGGAPYLMAISMLEFV